MTDIAEILGCSRQNLRELADGHKSVFPSPVHEGNSVSLWHLAPVLQWAREKGSYRVEDKLIEISSATMQINIARQVQALGPAFHRNIQALLV